MLEFRKPLFSGGVMRCCIATLVDHEMADGADDEGTVLPCKYCSSALHVFEGAWRWFREYKKDAKVMALTDRVLAGLPKVTP